MRDIRAIGFEKAVIGTVLYDPETFSEAVDLFPNDFTGSHQNIWAEICRLHEYDSIDYRALVERLRTDNVLETLSSIEGNLTGEEYLASMLEFRGSAMRTYVEGVLNASLKRQLRQVAALILADAEDERVDAQEAADEAERRLLSLRRSRLLDVGVPIGDILSVFNTRVEGMRSGALQPAWVPTNPALRNLVSYFDREDYVIIAARPGDGKSSLMRYEMAQTAALGHPSLIVNMENDELEYAKFLIALWTGIDSEKLKNPTRLTEDELHRAHRAAQEIATIPLYIKSMANPTGVEVERVCNLHIAKFKVERIGIDYIQLIYNNIENRVQDVSRSSSILRGIAKRSGVPLWAACQMSRSIEHRGEDADPKLADLRESGSLEQDATMVIFIRRVWHNAPPDVRAGFPENVDRNGNLYLMDKAIPIRLHLAKNRNGGTGLSSAIKWIRAWNDFQTLTELP